MAITVYDLITYIPVMFVPLGIAMLRRHQHALAIGGLNTLFVLSFVGGSILLANLGLLQMIIRFYLPLMAGSWIALLLWGIIGHKRAVVISGPADHQGNAANRRLPENIAELDKLARNIRKSLKESEKES